MPSCRKNSKRPKNSAKPSSANSTPRSSRRSSGTISTSKFRDASKAFTRSGARCSANRSPSKRFTTCSPSGSSSSRCRSPRKRHSAGRYSRLSPTSTRRNRIACATGFRCPRPTATKRCTRQLWVPTASGSKYRSAHNAWRRSPKGDSPPIGNTKTPRCRTTRTNSTAGSKRYAMH